MNADVIALSPYGINPYHVGLSMFEYLEREYGRDFIFEVRERENDLSFLRNYLTKQMVEEMDLYIFKQVDHTWQITDKEWEKVKQTLIQSKVNGGFPYIVVRDGDYNRNRELYLQHSYEGIELDPHYIEKTLPMVYRLWGRPVHLETIVEEQTMLYSCNSQTDEPLSKKKLDRVFH